MAMTLSDAAYEAMGELGAALIQVNPSDDPIIVEHLRRAHATLQSAYREHQRAQRTAAIDAAASIAFDNITARQAAKETSHART